MDVQRFKVSGEDWLGVEEVVCGEIIEASLVCLLWDYYYQVSRIFGSCLSRVIECEIFRYNGLYIYFNTNVTSRPFDITFSSAKIYHPMNIFEFATRKIIRITIEISRTNAR